MKVLKNLWQAIKSLVDKEYRFLKKYAPKAEVAISIVNSLKSALDSPIADILANSTKTTLDNELLQKARTVLPVILNRLLLAKGIIDQAKNNTDVVNATLAWLKTRMPEGRKGFWVELAGELTVDFSDGDLSFAEGTGLAQRLYAEFYLNK